METLKKNYKNMTLRKYLVFSVIVTFGIIVLLSALIIWACISMRTYLLPASNQVYLTVDQTYSDGREISSSIRVNVGKDRAELPVLLAENETDLVVTEAKYTIERIENSVDALSPKRKMLYYFCGISMVVFPFIFSISGILLCGFHFYKRKLSVPLELLSEATKQILNQNLDFCLQYEVVDEMGMLCKSFEQMRHALQENYRQMWKMIEERKLLQASIAHDLRNPIAIIEGYAEYLQINLENLSNERILQIADNLNMAAKRLERYTESVRTMNQMEDIEINRQKICVSDLVSDMEDDLKMMAKNHNIHFEMHHVFSKEEIYIDTSILYRVLENVFQNTLRYAKKNIHMEWSLIDKNLSIILTDDGNGFSDEVLERQRKLLFIKSTENGHLGMGLVISRILSEKHGGSLEIYNNSAHHAVVKIMFSV